MALTVTATAVAQEVSGNTVTALAHTGTVATTTGWLAFVSVKTSDSTVTHTAPTDTAGNTYAALGTAGHVECGKQSQWLATNITGHAANVVTAHFGSSAYDAIVVIYISGGATASATDTQVTTITPVDNTIVTSDTFTTNNADDIIIAGIVPASGGDTMSADTIGGVSGTFVTSAASNTGELGCWYRIVSASQSNITATVTTSGFFAKGQIIGVAIKAASTGSDLGVGVSSIGEPVVGGSTF